MVAQHYRWDFYGLSTDSKPDATNPKVANGSTYYEADTSKLYVWYNDQWYEKEAGGAGELPIASADTLGGVKIGEGLSITEAGVLSASGGGGEAGAFHVLTSADYNYPENNPSTVALWKLPNGIYYVDNASSLATSVKINVGDSSTYYHGSLFMIFGIPQDSSGVKMIMMFGNPNEANAEGTYAMREYLTLASDGSDWGGFIFEPTAL